MSQIQIDTDLIKPPFQAAIDALIDNLGKSVILFTKKEKTSANFDPIHGGYDEPKYKSGKVEEADKYTKETITALIDRNPRNFETELGSEVVKNPDGVLRLKTYLTHLPALQKCDFILPDADVRQYVNATYELLREGEPTGLIESRYCITFWKRRVS